MDVRTALPVQPVEGVTTDKIWSVAKTSNSLTIWCDGAKVLVYDFAINGTESECESYWLGDVIERFQFASGKDTSSDFYTIGDLSTSPSSNFTGKW